MTKKKQPRFKVPRTEWKLPEYCSNPKCGAKNSIKEVLLPSVQLIKGEETHCETMKYRCVDCEMTFQSPTQATAGVKVAVAKYQKKHELMTAEELKATRQKMGVTSVAKLAEMSEGVLSEATLKRIESGVHVQDAKTNYAIKMKLKELEPENTAQLQFSIDPSNYSKMVCLSEENTTIHWEIREVEVMSLGDDFNLHAQKERCQYLPSIDSYEPPLAA